MAVDSGFVKVFYLEEMESYEGIIDWKKQNDSLLYIISLSGMEKE